MAEILAGLAFFFFLAVIAVPVVLDADIRRGMGVYALILLVGCAVPAFLGKEFGKEVGMVVAVLEMVGVYLYSKNKKLSDE